jgi:arylsulfatase
MPSRRAIVPAFAPILRAVLLAALACVVACRPAKPPPRHLVLITVDTLRADHLGVYGDTLGLTPELDAFAPGAQVFDYAYSPAPFTLPSVTTILTGRYPGETKMMTNRATLETSVPTLASELYVRGFRTAAAVSNFVVRSATGLSRGFEVYDDEMPLRDPTRKLPWRDAAGTTRAALRAVDTIRGDDRRIFLWVHYQDAHGPYLPPPAVREAYLPAEAAKPDGLRELPIGTTDTGIGEIPRYQAVEGKRQVAFYRAGYDGGVHQMDEQVGVLLRGLAERGLLDDAVVAFTADHGEGLGENDYWFAHGENLSDELIRVPLLLRAPGLAPTRRQDVVALADLAGTLARALGERWGDGPGRDLLARGASDADSIPAFSTFGTSTVYRRGLVYDRHKYVSTTTAGGLEEEVFRLEPRGSARVSDPGPLLASLRERMGSLAGLVPEGRRVTVQEVSPEERARLEALGYVEGH